MRESIETIVFVGTLFCLLKSFGAEAFMIPTGSMAPTLLGMHKEISCPECGHHSLVNATEEAENPKDVVRSAICQNCRLPLDVSKLTPTNGDRVIVGKLIYEGLRPIRRWDVVVFKCPEFRKSRENYIKRFVGLPDETIHIRRGDIHVASKGRPPKIASKTPMAVLETRRLVYDTEHPAKDLSSRKDLARWQPTQSSEWNISDDHRQFSPAKNGNQQLVYKHILSGGNRSDIDSPQLIADFEEYNSGRAEGRFHANWVGDLLLECQLHVSEAKGSVYLELGEGTRRYRASFDFGENATVRVQQGERVLASYASTLKSPGKYSVRFANVDDLLWVWVNESLLDPQGIQVEPLSDEEIGPTESDLTPAVLGTESAGGVVISKLRLYRDIYYTRTARHADVALAYPQTMTPKVFRDWHQDLVQLDDAIFVLGNEEFFALGDNSPCSFDSREWRRTHLIARDLIQGRALLLYWPFPRFKFVH